MFELTWGTAFNLMMIIIGLPIAGYLTWYLYKNIRRVAPETGVAEEKPSVGPKQPTTSESIDEVTDSQNAVEKPSADKKKEIEVVINMKKVQDTLKSKVNTNSLWEVTGYRVEPITPVSEQMTSDAKEGLIRLYYEPDKSEFVILRNYEKAQTSIQLKRVLGEFDKETEKLNNYELSVLVSEISTRLRERIQREKKPKRLK